MHGLANILSDNPTLQPTKELQEFLEVLSSVQNGLNQSIQGIPSQVQQGESIAAKVIDLDINKTPPAYRPCGVKRRQLTIFPLSPENRQMRKNLYAPF